MKLVALLVAALTGAALALVTAYNVEPVRADWAGKADPHPANGVSQILTVNFDEPIYCELFVGEGDTSSYHVRLLTCPGQVTLAEGYGNASHSHVWVKCSLDVTYPDSFIKGRKVEVRWTRTGDDSINFYYDADNPYTYGSIEMGGGRLGAVRSDRQL